MYSLFICHVRCRNHLDLLEANGDPMVASLEDTSSNFAGLPSKSSSSVPPHVPLPSSLFVVPPVPPPIAEPSSSSSSSSYLPYVPLPPSSSHYPAVPLPPSPAPSAEPLLPPAAVPLPSRNQWKCPPTILINKDIIDTTQMRNIGRWYDVSESTKRCVCWLHTTSSKDQCFVWLHKAVNKRSIAQDLVGQWFGAALADPTMDKKKHMDLGARWNNEFRRI
jgi:hypothetical protein